MKSPTEIKNAQDINLSKKIRVGGMVKKNSITVKNEEIIAMVEAKVAL